MIRIAIVLIQSYFLKTYFLEALESTCQKIEGKNKQFLCSIQNVRDVTDFSCTATPHKCTATRTDYQIASVDDSTGTLQYTIEVSPSSYTKDAVTTTVNEAKSTDESIDLAKPVDLILVFTEDETPRLKCVDATPMANQFQSSSNCEVYTSTDSIELDIENSENCDITNSPASPEQNGILYKRVYTVTIKDKLKTCETTCTASVKMNDPSLKSPEITKELSHTSTCSGHIIDCSIHDASQRTITCKITVPYPFLRVEFTSPQSHVELTSATASFASTNRKDKVEHDIIYKIKDLQSTNKDFVISYEVIQTPKKTTLSGNINPTYTYMLLASEFPRLECEFDDARSGLGYNEKGYKCKAWSHTKEIELKSNQNKYVITPNTHDGKAINNLFTHEEFQIIVTPNTIVCNEEQSIEISFTENGNKRSKTVKQRIECQDPTIKPKSDDSTSRKITWTVSALYFFEISEITSQNEKIIVRNTQGCSQASGNPQETTCGVSYESNDLSVEKIDFKIDMNFKHSDAFKNTITTQNYKWIRNNDEKPFLKCTINLSKTGLAYHQKEYDCLARSLNNQITVKTKTGDLDINPASHTGVNEKKVYEHNYKLITTPHEISCSQKKSYDFIFSEKSNEQISTVGQTIKCPNPEISLKSHSKVNRQITWLLTAGYSFEIYCIESKNNDIIVTPNEVKLRAKKNSERNYRAEYTISYESKKLSVSEIEFKTEISFTHSDDFQSTIMTESLKWIRNKDESPSLDCSLKKAEVPVDIEKFAVSCNAQTIDENFELTLEPSSYVLQEKREKKRSYKGIFKWDHYEILVEDTKLECEVEQTMTLSYQYNGAKLSESIKRTVTCLEPTVICYGHDEIKRTLKCKFSIQYPVTKLKISSENSNVKMSPEQISENNLKSNYDISYKVSYSLANTKKFKIKFDFLQTGDKLIHTKLVEMEFKPKIDEIPKFSCSTKAEQPISSIGIVTYICDVRAKASGIPITTIPNTYRIHPEITTSTKAGNFYQDADYEISLTPIAMKCGHSEMVELSFRDGNIKYSSNVNHTTSCPVPTITCDEHDMVERTIICDFRIGYQFDDIKVSVNSERISLNSNKILFMSFNNGELQNHKITYTIIDRTTTSEGFSINFQVFQGGHHVVHDKSIGFRYFVKADEISQISCQKTIVDKKIKYESEIYDCMIVSYSSKVSLQTSTDDYALSPEQVQGNLYNGIYVHKNLILTVTPNVVKCGKQTDVGVFFTEDDKKFEFVLTHTTVCPDPIINCNNHDLYKREITCQIDVKFPFSTIDLSLNPPSSTVQINTATTVSYAEYITNPDHALKISYELKDLTHSDHHFNIQFTVKQESDNVATILKTFQYIYIYISTLPEIPHISCDQKIQTPLVEFEKITYNCDIVSHSIPINLVFAINNNNVITSEVVDNVISQGIYKISGKEILITPTDYSCIRTVPVKISLNAKDSLPEFTVTHTKSCPEPNIKCETHNLNTRKITCSIKIDFKFKEIRITTSSSNIRLSGISKVDTNNQVKYDNSHDIDYEIINIRNPNHIFDIIFDIIQKDDDTVVFQIIRNFRYKLTKDEHPYIKCTESTGDFDLQFYQSKFSCDIVSLNKEVSLDVNLITYKIDKHWTVGQDHKNLYKHTDVMIIVEPTEIVCDRFEKVGIRSIDADDKNLVEYVSHTTMCPDPTLSRISENDAERKLTLKLQADYKYEVINVKPDKQSFTLSSEVSSREMKEQTWKGEISITYEPKDWSIDSQEFHILVEVGQTEKWRTTVVSEKFTCNLKSEEKPQISCELKTSQILEDFTEKVFTCNAITRQSILTPSLSNENYKITSTKGLAKNLYSVYHWTDHEVVIQDIAITCNIEKTFNIVLTEYSQNLKSTITMRTICPTPKFSVKSHHKLKRIIIYNVESKFPSYATKINFQGKIVSFTKIESSIMKIGRRWKSTITITYTVNDLLKTDFTIPFSLLINQGTEKIGIVELPFEYELHDNEKRQISCEAQWNQTSEIFAVTEYMCYVVGKKSLSITVEPATYSLTYEPTSPTKLVNIWKWENVSVQVEDKSIICNKTINLTLTNSDGRDDKYSTIVQHTTICEHINGDCDILRKDLTYIFCNFTSNTKFTLRNFSCSESFNCTRSIDMEKSSEKWNQFVFELTPSSTDTLIEFDFNVTLQHSQFSPVPFSFILEYSTESKMIEEQKPSPAKIVTSFSHSIIYIAILAVLFTYVLIRRVKLSFNVYEHIEKPSFRNL